MDHNFSSDDRRAVGEASDHQLRAEYGSYAAEADAIRKSFSESVGALARSRVHKIIPEENTRRFIHGAGWSAPASPTKARDKVMVISDEYISKYADIVENDLSVIPAAIIKIATNMADQQIRNMFQTVSEVCDESGNVVDGAQKPFPEAFLEMLEKIEFGVDKKGEISMPSVFVGPEMAERLVTQLESQPPEYQARAEALIEEKKTAALAAEAERLARFRKPND